MQTKEKGKGRKKKPKPPTDCGTLHEVGSGGHPQQQTMPSATMVGVFKGAPPGTAAAPKTFLLQSLKTGLAAQLALSIKSRLGKHTLHDNSLKFRDLWQGRERAIAKFLHKRNGWDCFKENYTLFKTQPTAGSCSNCRNNFERKTLMVCNRSKLAQ